MARLRPRVTYSDSGQAVLDAASGGDPDPYAAQVVKFIPAEAITAYQAVLGVVSVAKHATQLTYISWTAGACLVFCFFWTLYGAKDTQEPPAVTQAIVATLGFVVWLLAVDSPAIKWFLPDLDPVARSVILILSTILILPLLGRVLHRWIGK